MDNQTNDQKSIKETSTTPKPIIPETPISEADPVSITPETQVPITVENPISTMTEVPVVETELPPSQPEPQPEPEIEETVPAGEYQNEYQDVLDQYAANQEITSPILENETPPLPSTPAPTITDSDIFPIPPQNNLFKIIFIISLIIFVLTATVLAFVYFKSKNNQKSPTSSTIIETAPTPTISDTCFLNDKTYQTGKTFTATDGCNTCTCVSQNNISCTDKECPSSKSATESAVNSTKTATSSSIPQDWKTYTNSTYKYSINYPNTWAFKTNTNKSISLETLESQKATTELSKVKGDIPRICGYYQIQCFKNLNEFVSEYKETTKLVSLYDYLLSDKIRFTNINKRENINGNNSYEAIEMGMDNVKEIFIEKKDSSFCEISFCDQDLTDIENQFINTFKFN